MVSLNLETWSALAPGLDTKASWQAWFDSSSDDGPAETSPALKQIPALLRRRFTTLGKYAAASTLNVLAENQSMPGIFASRHGDTGLTLSLLEEIARDQPISPTGFSLAVHNAVAGIISIARKDKSPITAISAMNGLLLQTLFEAAAQLERHERVFCVVYDIPLPALYQPYELSVPFPLALAFVVSRSDDAKANLTLQPTTQACSELSTYQEIFQFIKVLMDEKGSLMMNVNQANWHLAVDARQ
ncbi:MULTISPECIES: beta-ketoacyl synthase chain length factor [unclassified Methylophaga]|uniref:beta-ketoacyl synthase chain length factor n=1 Tax=unclassified Methylophaga TaxID=2629249 RepID=UPI0025F39659|nr:MULTISPECIES: beta-ketoacyl synthase chain length factor [unclassified Methylophaga]